MQLCFFEDRLCTNFQPLTLTRPVDDLRLGILTIAEKWQYALDACGCRLVRNELKPILPHLQRDESESCYWINSRFLPSHALLKQVKQLDAGTCIKKGDIMVAAHADAITTASWIEDGKPDGSAMLVLEGQNFSSVKNIWDLFLMNKQEIENDLNRLGYPSSQQHTISDHAVLTNRAQTFIGKGATIEPGVILMADNGPVFIGDGATIMAGAIVKGPTAVCSNATIKASAKIYPGTTIGPFCKAGGEISTSILHSYSNKGHDGFLGHSLIGQWCNIGANTNTSNLKNNYRPIRITDWHSRKEIETGQQFLGTVMGDHTKTAINTQLNTGTICGVSCNIFSNDFPPTLIPSFSWVGSNVIQPYKIEKALETMEAMMVRRDVELTAKYKDLMKTVFSREHA